MQDILLQQNVFGFKIAMNKTSLVKKTQPIQELLRKNPYQSRTQPSELVLLDKFVQVHTEQLKYEA